MSDILINKEAKNPDGEGKNILLVEDSQVVQNITKHVLEFYNHKVHTVLNGSEALDEIQSNDYDIILMDIAMPNMNGIECIGRLRKMEDPKKANLPVIAITGNAEFLSPIEFKKAGFSDFLEKPIDFDNMSRILKKFINAGSAK